mmetsp:Transcript_60916/g.191041  ORF Transcript_60916/g.191041 Transcript_60916/m.191041 type:complete len:206 (-) Transcript_60916:2-619(-)
MENVHQEGLPCASAAPHVQATWPLWHQLRRLLLRAGCRPAAAEEAAKETAAATAGRGRSRRGCSTSTTGRIAADPLGQLVQLPHCNLLAGVWLDLPDVLHPQVRLHRPAGHGCKPSAARSAASQPCDRRRAGRGGLTGQANRLHLQWPRRHMKPARSPSTEASASLAATLSMSSRSSHECAWKHTSAVGPGSAPRVRKGWGSSAC